MVDSREDCTEYNLFKQKPADPSPTPNDYSTWGFYCDTCDVFIDLVKSGTVTPTKGVCVYGHDVCKTDCVRYIGYDRSIASKM